MPVSRPTVIAGNWKMYKTIFEAQVFVKVLAPLIKGCSAKVWLAVPFTAIQAAAIFAQGTSIVIGAQNVNDAEEGAFTGEISCRMLKEAGAAFVIIGHSERRQLFREDDAWINRKLKQILKDGLKPIVCIGETLDQYQAGKGKEVVRSQLMQSLKDINSEEMKKVIIAYEPIWAIGTGKTATPEAAQEMQHFCRETISAHWDKTVAEQVVIQYGGSVKPDNAAALLAQPDIDGLLVGGASLSVDSFSKIVLSQNTNTPR